MAVACFDGTFLSGCGPPPAMPPCDPDADPSCYTYDTTEAGDDASGATDAATEAGDSRSE
jgi:hypothetical protein